MSGEAARHNTVQIREIETETSLGSRRASALRLASLDKIPCCTCLKRARGAADEMHQQFLREHGWLGEAARRKALALRERLKRVEGGMLGKEFASRQDCTYLNSIGRKALALCDFPDSGCPTRRL